MRTRLSLHDAAPAPAPLAGGSRSAIGARAVVPPGFIPPVCVPRGVVLVIAGLSLAGLSWVEAAEITPSAHGREAAAAPARTESTAAGQCLSRHEQRARIAARTVVPLAKATRAVVHGRGDDLLHARLCERDGRLVYLLTVLARGGKVLRVAVDAGSGTLIGAQR